jgi:PhoP regulatory network protein YrbL.
VGDLKRDDEMLIKIIDGLGSQAFVLLPSYSNFFAKRYVERRIELMDNRIKWDLSGRKGNWK